MRTLAIILLVLGMISFLSALNMRPPKDMGSDQASGYMIGTMILPVLFAASGAWCMWKGVKKARNKKQNAEMVETLG